MAALLTNWLNSEVKLSKTVTNFENDFQNGYLIGEILHHFNQVEDLDGMADQLTSDAKIGNWTKLKPILEG